MKIDGTASIEMFDSIESGEKCWDKCAFHPNCTASTYFPNNSTNPNCFLFDSNFTVLTSYGYTTFSKTKLNIESLTRCRGINFRLNYLKLKQMG